MNRAARRRDWILGGFLFALAISNSLALVRYLPYLSSGYQNFTGFYAAGLMVRQGDASHLYDVKTQYLVQKQVAPRVNIRQAALPYIHPPFEALLFAPLTWLAFWRGYLLWVAVNICLVLATIYILLAQAGELKPRTFLFGILAASAFWPLVSALAHGQDCVLLLLVFVWTMAAFKNDRATLAGALLAAGLFRFQLALPLLFLLSIRRPRVLIGFVPVAAGLTLLSFGMIGRSGVVQYISLLISLNESGAGELIHAASMPNLHGLFASLPELHARRGLELALTICSSVVVLGVFAWRVRTRALPVPLFWALSCVVAILVSYYSLGYDLTLLLPFLPPFLAGHMPAHRWHYEPTVPVLLYVLPWATQFLPSIAYMGWFALLLAWVFTCVERVAPQSGSPVAFFRNSTNASMGR